MLGTDELAQQLLDRVFVLDFLALLVDADDDGADELWRQGLFDCLQAVLEKLRRDHPQRLPHNLDDLVEVQLEGGAFGDSRDRIRLLKHHGWVASQEAQLL